MWKELIDQLKSKLATWRGKYFNMAGCVMLINAVLNTIPIFSLSFYRAPSKVINEIKKIQSNFLWNKYEGSHSVHWVSWKSVCYPKEDGSHGIKDIKVLNSTLLQKWKWRIIKEKNAVWSSLLRGRYGDPIIKVLIGNNSVLTAKDSIWWRDIVQSDCTNDNGNNLFTGSVLSKVNNGRGTAFWKSKWLGDQAVKDVYLEAFAATINLKSSVIKMIC